MKSINILIGVLTNAAIVATACVQLAQDFIDTKPKSIYLNEVLHPNAQVSLATAVLGQCKKSARLSVQFRHLFAEARLRKVSTSKEWSFSSARSQG